MVNDESVGGRTAKATVTLGALPIRDLMLWFATRLRFQSARHSAFKTDRQFLPRYLEPEMHSKVCDSVSVPTEPGSAKANSFFGLGRSYAVNEVEHNESERRCDIRHSELDLP